MQNLNDDKSDMLSLLNIKPGWNDVRVIIKNNLLSRDLDATFICEALNISRSSLFRLFDGRGGIESYIRSQRIKQVRLALLKYGNRVRVKDLARYWHFSDSSHLGRVFRQAYGLTIREFRKSLKS